MIPTKERSNLSRNRMTVDVMQRHPYTFDEERVKRHKIKTIYRIRYGGMMNEDS